MAEETLPELQLSSPDILKRVKDAVARRGGKVTLGDVVTECGVSNFEAERALKNLLATHEGHLNVSENGDLIYIFDKNLMLRDDTSGWEKFKKGLFKFLKTAYKVWIAVTLVFYFIVYLALIIFLIFGNRNSNSRGINLNWIIWFWSPGSPNYDENGEPIKKVPFYKKVFQFVFGPEEEKPDPLRAQMLCSNLIKAKRGTLCVEDWMLVSGNDREKAESEMAKFTAIFDGKAEITSDGQLIYSFPELMRSQSGNRALNTPNFTWKEPIAKKEFTGNSTGANVGIGFLNGFNLIMATIFSYAALTYVPVVSAYPALHEPDFFDILISMDGVGTVLGFIPLVFSILFFLIPIIRSFKERKENQRRREANIRKALLQAVYNSKVGNHGDVSVVTGLKNSDNLLERAGMSYSDGTEIDEQLKKLTVELDGDITGDKTYSFSRFHEHLEGAEKERNKLNLDHQDLGKIVFSTENTEEANRINEQGDLDDFDKRLQREKVMVDSNGNAMSHYSY